MIRHAIVLDGQVQDIILWDGEADYDHQAAHGEGSLIVALPDDSPVGPGWSYNGSNFSAPPPPVVEKWFSLSDFYGFFTLTEITLHNAVIDSVVPADATSSDPARIAAAEYKAWVTVLNHSPTVNLMDPRLPGGLALARAVGVLSSDARVAQVLAGQAPG